MWYYICKPFKWIMVEIRYRRKLKKLEEEEKDNFIYE